jgi:hypothetical protein
MIAGRGSIVVDYPDPGRDRVRAFLRHGRLSDRTAPSENQVNRTDE